MTPASETTWRPILGEDMTEVFRIADAVYPPHLFETDDALLGRVNMGGGWCYVLDNGREIGGYCIAHPWDLTIPRLGMGMGMGYPQSFDTLYIHDLAILPAFRGAAHGSAIAQRLKRDAASAFGRIRLVSVNGSLPFWTSCGFHALAEKPEGMDSYGADAVPMEWHR